jgi:hypothetical protein
MSIAFVQLTAFNAHGSEHNLINQGRIEGETIRNDNAKKIVSKKEESLYIRNREKQADAKRNVKVTMTKMPWE